MPGFLLSILQLFYTFLGCHWCFKGLHWPGDICAPSISEHWTLAIACLHISPRLMQFYMMRLLIWLLQYITCISYMFESFVIWMTSLSKSSSLATFAWAASETQVHDPMKPAPPVKRIRLKLHHSMEQYSDSNCGPQKVPTQVILDGKSQASREVAGRGHQISM